MYNGFSELFEVEKARKCRKGQVLISRDEAPRGAFFIRQGFVKAYDIGVRGDYQLAAICGPGEVFPLHWALGNDYNLLFYEAMSTTEYSILAKQKFQAQVYGSYRLLELALTSVIKSYHFSQQRIRSLQQRTARQRLACYLALLTERYGFWSAQAKEITMPIMYQDLADATNLTRETVNRIIGQFKIDGLIDSTRQHIVIRDLHGLKHIVGDE